MLLNGEPLEKIVRYSRLTENSIRNTVENHHDVLLLSHDYAL